MQNKHSEYIDMALLQRYQLPNQQKSNFFHQIHRKNAIYRQPNTINMTANQA